MLDLLLLACEAIHTSHAVDTALQGPRPQGRVVPLPETGVSVRPRTKPYHRVLSPDEEMREAARRYGRRGMRPAI